VNRAISSDDESPDTALVTLRGVKAPGKLVIERGDIVRGTDYRAAVSEAVTVRSQKCGPNAASFVMPVVMSGMLVAASPTIAAGVLGAAIVLGVGRMLTIRSYRIVLRDGELEVQRRWRRPRRIELADIRGLSILRTPGLPGLASLLPGGMMFDGPEVRLVATMDGQADEVLFVGSRDEARYIERLLAGIMERDPGRKARLRMLAAAETTAPDSEESAPGFINLGGHRPT